MASMVPVSERIPPSTEVKNVMEALLTLPLLTQINDGDTVKFVNKLLPLLKILPSTTIWW